MADSLQDRIKKASDLAGRPLTQEEKDRVAEADPNASLADTVKAALGVTPTGASPTVSNANAALTPEQIDSLKANSSSPAPKLSKEAVPDTANEDHAAFAKLLGTPDQPKAPDMLADSMKQADAQPPSPPVISKQPERASTPRVSTGLNKTDTDLNDQMARLQSLTQTPTDSGKHTDFDSLADKVKQAYEDSKSELDKRELAETIGNALGKIGGGLYGLNTNTDMSKVQFNKQDWEAKRDRALKELQLNIADLSENRKEENDNNQFGQKLNLERSQQAQNAAQAQVSNNLNKSKLGLEAQQLTETGRHNQALEQLAGDKTLAETALKQAKLRAGDGGKADAALNKANKELADKITTTAQAMSDGKLDEETGKAQLSSYLQADLGVSPEKAHELVAKPGMLWGESMRDPSEIINSVNAIAAVQHHINSIKSSNPGTILVKNLKTGQVGTVPEAQRAAVEQNPDYKVIQ